MVVSADIHCERGLHKYEYKMYSEFNVTLYCHELWHMNCDQVMYWVKTLEFIESVSCNMLYVLSWSHVLGPNPRIYGICIRSRNGPSGPMDRPGQARPNKIFSRAGRAKILLGPARPDVLSFILLFYKV